MQVIKGPAAATLYGTEASNGVIQIITKKGGEGRPKYDFTTRTGSMWFSDPQGRIPPNYYQDTDGSIKFQDLVAQQDAAGAPLYKNGVLQTYEGVSDDEAKQLHQLIAHLTYRRFREFDTTWKTFHCSACSSQASFLRTSCSIRNGF